MYWNYTVQPLTLNEANDGDPRLVMRLGKRQNMIFRFVKSQISPVSFEFIPMIFKRRQK